MYFVYRNILDQTYVSGVFQHLNSALVLCKAGVVWSLTTLTKNKARSLITNSVSREVGKLGVWAVAHVAAYYEYVERHSNLLNDIQYHPPPPTRIYTREEVARLATAMANTTAGFECSQ